MKDIKNNKNIKNVGKKGLKFSKIMLTLSKFLYAMRLQSVLLFCFLTLLFFSIILKVYNFLIEKKTYLC